jgi:hypothetical protein
VGRHWLERCYIPGPRVFPMMHFCIFTDIYLEVTSCVCMNIHIFVIRTYLHMMLV